MNGIIRRGLESILIKAGVKENVAVRIVSALTKSKEINRLRVEVTDTAKYLGISELQLLTESVKEIYTLAKKHPRMRSENIALYCLKEEDKRYTNLLYKGMSKSYTRSARPLID